MRNPSRAPTGIRVDKDEFVVNAAVEFLSDDASG